MKVWAGFFRKDFLVSVWDSWAKERHIWLLLSDLLPSCGCVHFVWRITTLLCGVGIPCQSLVYCKYTRFLIFFSFTISSSKLHTPILSYHGLMTTWKWSFLIDKIFLRLEEQSKPFALIPSFDRLQQLCKYRTLFFPSCRAGISWMHTFHYRTLHLTT